MKASGATFSCTAVGEEAQVGLGVRLGRQLKSGGVVFLDGDLGAGKTTLSRGILQAFGHRGAVKSPTYTLVEPYQFGAETVYHFDLYRLADPEELEYIGIRDYFAEPAALCLVEWPERGEGYLPRPDLLIEVSVAGDGRRIDCTAGSERGRIIINALEE